MKTTLLTLACLAFTIAHSQTPYNPDSDGDNLIGAFDLVDFLPLYGQPFFPESTSLVIFETGYLTGSDTSFVPEAADVVFVQGFSGSNTHIQLPLDTTLKQISLIYEHSSSGGFSTILGHWQGSYNYEAAFEWRNIAFCMRNRLGQWKCLEH